MDIIQIKSIIESSLSSNELLLPVSKLSSSAITEISNQFLPNNNIHITEARIAESLNENNIIVLGKGVDFPFNEIQVQINFYLQNNEAAFKFIATGDSNWTLAVGINS